MLRVSRKIQSAPKKAGEKADKTSRPKGKRASGALIIAPKIAEGAKSEVIGELIEIGAAATVTSQVLGAMTTSASAASTEVGATLGGAVAKTGGIFSRFIGLLTSGASRLVALCTGTTAAVAALAVAVVGAIALQLHRIGLLATDR